MTQDPATRTSGRQEQKTSAPDASSYTVEELAKVVAMAETERRRFELDPRGRVEPQVRAKLQQLRHRGYVVNDRQESQARLFFAHYYQEQGGIENPRLLSNQERAELVQDFRRSDLAARVDIMKDLEGAFLKQWPKAYGELVDGLPLRERAIARRTFERFEHHRLHSVDPAVGLNIDDWSGELDDLSTAAAFPDARISGASRSATVPDKVDDAPPPELPDTGTAASASPNPSMAPGITDDWTGPGLDAERSAFLAGLVDEILAAAPGDLPILEERIAAAFADDLFTVRRLTGLARARLGEGVDFLVPVGGSQTRAAEASLRTLRDQLQAGRDYNDERREDRAAFATLETASGLRLRLRHDGKIAIGEPNQPPLASVSWSVVRAITRNPEKVRERFALIDHLITSKESDHALRNEIDRALGLISGDEGGEPRDFEGTRQAILAARAAMRDGADPAAVRAALVATFFPEVAGHPIAWGELLLDVLPIIGEIRSAFDAVENFDAMTEALARGNLGDAAKQGLLGVLATAGAVPVVGPLFKTIRTVTVRAVRSRTGSEMLQKTPLISDLTARHKLARSRAGMPSFVKKIHAEEVFRDLWESLSTDKRKLLRGLMPHLKGKPVERDLERQLENAGIDVIATQQQLNLVAAGITTVLDAVSKNGFSDGVRILTNSFIFPTMGAPGTIFEFKLGDALLSRSQKAVERTLAQLRSKGATLTLGNISVVDLEVLRLGFDEISEDMLEREARRLLGNHANGVRSRRLTRADVDELVSVFIA